MLRVLYEELNVNDVSPEIINENLTQNMTQSDIYFNKETLQHSAYAWIKSDINRNFQDLEKFFRLNNFNSYLIAKKIKVEEHFILKTPNNNVNNLLYDCQLICKPKDIALQEVLDEYSTYDENFENLSKSGNLCIKLDDDKEMLQEQNIMNDDNSLIKKLMDNKIKLIFKKLNPKESIEQMSEDILKTTGNKPTIKIIGKLNDECPIMAFLLNDGSVASNIAWTIIKENNETIYQLIDLNEYYAKNK